MPRVLTSASSPSPGTTTRPLWSDSERAAEPGAATSHSSIVPAQTRKPGRPRGAVDTVGMRGGAPPIIAGSAVAFPASADAPVYHIEHSAPSVGFSDAEDGIEETEMDEYGGASQEEEKGVMALSSFEPGPYFLDSTHESASVEDDTDPFSEDLLRFLAQMRPVRNQMQ